MKIELLQVRNIGEVKFEIKHNNTLKYLAKLPYISIEEPFNLEKLRKIEIYDLNNNLVYKTDYKYLDNLKEEIFPFKYLITGSQKFNQLLFTSSEKEFKIYHETNELFKSRYVIEIDNKRYFCYSKEEGYIRHFPLYDGELQIGEALKCNAVINNNEEYCCYLKEGYENLSDGITALLLYLDRNEYNSSYNNMYAKVTKSYSFSKNDKYYDKDWVKNNFGDEFYQKAEKDIAYVKEQIKHPIKASINQINAMNNDDKKAVLNFIIMIFIGFLIIFLLIMFI